MSVPVEELVNTLEFEPLAKNALAPSLYSLVAGSERAAFERITFRPRMMVDTTKLDLSFDLFGQKHFAPLLVGPVTDQRRFHADGEPATARGALKAKAGFVASGESFEKVASVGPCWCQVTDVEKAKQAVQLGAKAIVMPAPLDWASVDQTRKAATVPLLLKGIMSVAEAKAAVQRGANGIVLSNYRGTVDTALASPIEVLPAVAAEVKIPILVDGGIRRGSDALKALALGARAVLVARPVMWGLTAYGERGVQQVMEMLQTELARDMAMCGLPTLASITGACIRVHRR